MAAKTPAAYGDTGWIDPIMSLPMKRLSTVVEIGNSPDGSFRSYYFGDVDNTDSWASTIPLGHVAGAWAMTTHATQTISLTVSDNSGDATFGFLASGDDNVVYLVVRLNSY